MVTRRFRVESVPRIKKWLSENGTDQVWHFLNEEGGGALMAVAFSDLFWPHDGAPSRNVAERS